VQILDASGKVIATPAHGIMGRGEYVVSFSGSSLPAGTYFCRVLNGMQHQTKTVVKVGNN
jgi:hypothetical protein